MAQSPPIPFEPPRTRPRPGERAGAQRVEDRRNGGASDGGAPPPTSNGSGGDGPAGSGGRPQIKRLRLAFILAGLSVLAVISTIFGMMMAVASELPALENQAEFQAAQNSVLLPARGNEPIAKVTGNQNRILLREGQVSTNIENAVIAIEDRRFYEHEGVDYRGIGRALVQDLKRGGAVQGGSTITQQFVKNALEAQNDRTMFQKLRESALAYHLERQWSKRKVLTQYMNTVYFGNGAYGVESAVRTYFPHGREFGPDDRAATNVEPHEAAMLAAIIASPSAYDPVQNPKDAKRRRDLVLRRMLEERMITQTQYDEGIVQAIPSDQEVTPPQPDSRQPYFSSWVTQQLVDRYRSGQVFGGGLKIRTTLDMDLQQAAEQAISSRLPAGGPTASLVAIENKTGAVKAMVGGADFENKPFNLATNGRRQPGSAIKPFTLVAALEQGVSPNDTFESRKRVFPLPGRKGGNFVVSNYEDQYAGVTTLAEATRQSDNAVYAKLGIDVGTRQIARTAAKMGVRTPLSTNLAMTLGGLKQGLTPLELAYAYSTLANRGERRSGTMASSDLGPVAIQSVQRGKDTRDRNRLRKRRVFPRRVGEDARQMLQRVVTGGTGKAANLGPGTFAAGKTGTTENYGDAWFVGFTDEMTVAVWVGYPDKLRYMKTEYRGGPVAGGTFPAEIWRDFMLSAMRIDDARNPDEAPVTPVTPVPSPQATPTPAPTPAPSTPPPATPTPQAPPTPSQQPQPSTPAPAPSPTPAPGGGAGGTGGATGGAGTG